MSENMNAWKRALKAIRAALENGDKITETFWEQLQHELITLEKLSETEVEELLQTVRQDWLAFSANSQAIMHTIEDWLSFAGEAFKEYLQAWLALVSDKTALAWLASEALGDVPRTRRTGQMVSMGRWQCVGCGEFLSFQHPGRLPPCPRCHETEFRLDLPPVGSKI